MNFNSDFVIVDGVRRAYSNRFNVSTAEYTFRFHPNGLAFFDNFLEWYEDCFKNILILIREKTEPHHRVGLRVSLPSTENTTPLFIPFTRCDQLTPDMIVSVIENVAQSNKAFESGEQFVIQATVLRTVIVGVRGKYFVYILFFFSFF